MRLGIKFLRNAAVAAAGLVLLAAPAAAQQDFPNRPMHVYIGFPAGSGADILGRYFTTHLEKLAGKPVIVENKPGANSNIAAGIVAKAKPDGYSILFIANSNMAGSRFLFKNLPFDTVKDFVPAASFASIAFVITVSAKSPIKTVADLTAYLKGREAEQVRHHQPDRDPGVGVLQAGRGRRGRQRRLPHRAGGAAGRRGRHARLHGHGRHLRDGADQGRQDPRAGGDDRGADRRAARCADHEGEPVSISNGARGGASTCRRRRRRRSWTRSAAG